MGSSCCTYDDDDDLVSNGKALSYCVCDLIWHVISRSGVVISITNCYIRLTYLLTYLLTYC